MSDRVALARAIAAATSALSFTSQVGSHAIDMREAASGKLLDGGFARGFPSASSNRHGFTD
jgi:hypothetical protein